MKTKKRLCLSELEGVMTPFEDGVLRAIIGGGDGSYSNPYTWDEYQNLARAGTWDGGYVKIIGTSMYLYSLTGGGYTGNGGVLNNPNVQSVMSMIGQLFNRTFGKVFDTAQMYSYTEDRINNKITDAEYINRMFWTALAMTSTPFGGLLLGTAGYLAEAVARYGAQQIINFSIEMDQKFKNPNTWNPGGGNWGPD